MAVVGADDEEFRIETREASPTHLLIKIKTFSLLSKHGIEKYESREFTAGDYNWRLIIHPNGPIESGDEDDHISVFLTNVKTSTMPLDWEVNAIFSIFLYNQILDNYLCLQSKMRRFLAMKPEWGFSKLISKGSLRAPGNGFLVDDNCVFGAEIAIIQQSPRAIEHMSLLNTTYPCKRDWQISSFSKLEGVWNSEEFTAGDQKWKFMLHPNGNGSEVGRSVSMFVECVSSRSFAPHQKVKADFCMRIKNQLNKNHRSINLSHWFTSSVPDWGMPALIKIADMRDTSKGFIVKDCCFIEVEVSVQAVVSDAS